MPPLASEDHVCDDCGLSYGQTSVDEAVAVIRTLPDEVREAVSGVTPDARGQRPSTDTWSVTEYVCHLRDVYATYTIRLHRTRTEDEPVLEPMLNDLRARRFRYNELDVDAVLGELAANAAGFCDEVARNSGGQWERTATRQPGERRTARWLVRQAMHEGRHHLRDIRRTGVAVSGNHI